MNLLSLITFLEARFAIAISSADVVFGNLDSVQHIVAFVARKRAIIPIGLTVEELSRSADGSDAAGGLPPS